MGLFSKKKERVIDMEKSAENKKKLRALFNQAVEDGDTYKILYAGASESVIDRGLVVDTRISTFYNYVVGYREYDYNVAVVEVDRDMTMFSEPNYVRIDEIKETNYYKKICQAWFIYKDKASSRYGVKLEIDDQSSTSKFGIPNISQEFERENFLDFMERYTEHLRQMGFKIKKWTR